MVINKFNSIIFIIFIVIFSIFLFIKHEMEAAKNELIIDQQKEEIREKADVIQTKNFQQKLISKPALSSDVVTRDEWMQLLWEKTDQVN